MELERMEMPSMRPPASFEKKPASQRKNALTSSLIYTKSYQNQFIR
jgi:hypothetical protein